MDSAKASNRVLPGVQCFAWNHDTSMVALCPVNNEIWIYDTQLSPDVNKWKRFCVLKEHYNVITALKWHPTTHLLISASADRGVIVWKLEDKQFLPQMGMIKESRANLDASWNTRGDKFCIAASTGCVYVGTYFEQNNFWVAHTVSKSSNKPIHKASAVCARFDPGSSRVTISSSLDGTIQITSCYNKDVDVDGTGPFAGVTTYGENLLSVSCNGWVNQVDFSPNCEQICYVTHDCEVNFADVTKVVAEPKNKPDTQKIMHNGNPHLQCMFIADDKVVCTGYDKVPYLYKKEGKDWKMNQILDQGISKTRTTKIGASSFQNKRVHFNSDFKLNTQVELKETDTKHVNYINFLNVFAQNSGKPTVLCTSDVNGFLNYWDVSKV